MSIPSVRLADIATCFEGVFPSPICTCSSAGIPNITYLSIVHRVDDDHVALSVQFFNKTRRNVLENSRAQVLLVAPEKMTQYRLDLAFEHTEVRGAVFDYVRTRLDAIASQTGMKEVFGLRGVDIYRVVDCRPLIEEAAHLRGHRDTGHLARVAALTAHLSACRDLDQLVNTALEQLASVFGCPHSFLMARDEEGRHLYTLASRGFPSSGIGSEVAIGEGLIGSAAERRVAVRSTSLARDRIMSRRLRQELTRTGDQDRLEHEIPLPGLATAQSQLVVPLVAHDDLIGVLCVQSESAGRFLAADETTLQVVGHHLAACMAMLGFASTAAPAADAPPPSIATVAGGESATVKYYRSDDSVFIDDAYLIKGLPGRLLYKLLCLHLNEGRDEFTNKELRLDASLKLPDFNDNLEARLILLRRRLEERCGFLKLSRAGRGRLRVSVAKNIRLEELA
jgi:adenylate cyclase